MIGAAIAGSCGLDLSYETGGRDLHATQFPERYHPWSTKRTFSET